MKPDVDLLDFVHRSVMATSNAFNQVKERALRSDLCVDVEVCVTNFPNAPVVEPFQRASVTVQLQVQPKVG